MAAAIVIPISRLFEQQTFARGKAYYEEGRALVAEFDEDHLLLFGTVKGSRHRAYETVVCFYQPNDSAVLDIARSSCACPMMGDCKHVVALLLQWQSESARLEGHVRKPDKQDIRQDPSLDFDLGTWFSQIRPETTEKKASSANQREVVYLLEALTSEVEDKCFASVTIETFNIKKDGSYGKNRGNLNLGRMLYEHLRPKGVRANDVAIARSLPEACIANGYYEGLVVALEGKVGAWLLAQMLATGRCYWQTPYGRKLILAKPLNAMGYWRVLEDGSQSFEHRVLDEHGVHIRDVSVLPFLPLHYVRHSTGEIGSLLSDFDESTASMLQTCPRVPPSQTAIFADHLGKQFPKAPLPNVVKKIREKKINVQPTLVLTQVYEEQSQCVVPAVEIHYAGDNTEHVEQSLQSQSADPLEPHIEQGILTIPKLAKKDHAKHAERLSALGLQALPSYEQKTGAAVSQTMILPAKNSAELHENIATFAQLQDEGFSHLEKEGWKVQPDALWPITLSHAGENWDADIEPDEEINDWFNIELGIEVDGIKTPLVPILLSIIASARHADTRTLEKLLEEEKIYVPLESGIVLCLPAKRIRSVLRVIEKLLRGNPDFSLAALEKMPSSIKISRYQVDVVAELAEAAKAASVRWTGNEELHRIGRRLRDLRYLKKIRTPRGFTGELRGYQQEGLNWLSFMTDSGYNGILADDMGLGKTIQALALLYRHHTTSVADRPSLIVAPTSVAHNWVAEAHRFSPGLKVVLLRGTEREQHFERLKEYDLAITTYPLLLKDRKIHLKQKFHMVILDEAQNIKNAKSQAALIVQRINSRHRFCLTGTPVENHLGELWSLFHFLMPGLLGTQKVFNTNFRIPIEKHGDLDAQRYLHRRTRAFILRRTKEEVLQELPKKTTFLRRVTLEKKQRDLYESIRIAMHQRVRQAISSKGLQRSQITILDALLKLRQTCCDPRILPNELAQNIKESCKLNDLTELLEQLVETDRRVLIFSQFTSMLQLIEERLHERGWRYVKLTGSTKDRAKPIQEFEQGNVPIFLISLKAGGTGLNLTTADSVIHYDPWWNPATENQATDRAHRIGQTKPVFVHKLIAENTVEEKIIELQQHKAKLAEALFDANSSAPWRMSEADVETLFEPL